MAILNLKSVPDELYRSLQERAKRHYRSVSQEVLCILNDALGTPEQESILELKGLGKARWEGVDAAKHVAELRDEWD